MAEQNEVIYHILEYLNSLKNESNADGVDTITSLLESEFQVTRDASTFQQFSLYPVGLPDLVAAGKSALSVQSYEASVCEAKKNPKFESFVEAVVARGYFAGTDEQSIDYHERYAKLISKFAEKVTNAPAAASPEEIEKKAEELKLKGNAAINAKNFQEAVDFYSEALNLTSEGPNSHVYYSNRAAAYCHLNKYQEAVDDCLSSVTLSPDYVKAYSRLGLCYFFLEKYQEAVDAYERAAEIEPDNKGTQDSLRQARNKLKKVKAKDSEVAAAAAPGAGAGAGFPNMSGLMNNPAMKKALDQVGGPTGLSSLMKDPQMMAMAQQMMKDPQMMQQAMSMLGGGGAGGGGGMPDLSSLAGLMGGMGGMDNPPSSSSAPSSSSGKGGKKAFKGFEE